MFRSPKTFDRRTPHLTECPIFSGAAFAYSTVLGTASCSSAHVSIIFSSKPYIKYKKIKELLF